MNENRLPDYLEHMQQAAADACVFVEGLDKDDFQEDKRTQQAVIMSLIDHCLRNQQPVERVFMNRRQGIDCNRMLTEYRQFVVSVDDRQT